MKTTIIKGLIAIALLVISCQRIDIQEEITSKLVEKDKKNQSGVKVEYGVNLKTASYLGKLLSQKEIKKVEAKTYGNDTLMYIIDYKDGWAVLSADKRMTPVLAEASTGTFSKEVENDLMF